jgi:hypothetical protein
MKTLPIFLLLFIANLSAFSQYSLNGVFAEKYSEDSLTPLPNIQITLLENQKFTQSAMDGTFGFENLQKGMYSVQIECGILNKLIIENIELAEDTNLDTILMIVDYNPVAKIVVHSAWSLSSLLETFKNNGSFVKDTLTNNFYEQGLYVEGKTIPDKYREDYLWEGDNYYRQGEWKWKYDTINLLENYNKGIVDGKTCAYYDNGKMIYSGEYKNNRKNGVWIFFDYYSHGNDFSLEYRNGYLVIDLHKFSIKKYNRKINTIYGL